MRAPVHSIFFLEEDKVIFLRENLEYAVTELRRSSPEEMVQLEPLTREVLKV